MTSKCQYCNEGFEPNLKNRRYCSLECSKNGNRLVAQCKAFGLTLENYFDLLSKQKKCCAICKQVLGSGKFNIHIDHDHKSGKVRGLLCRSCNLLLGHARDDISILDSGIRYLRSFM